MPDFQLSAPFSPTGDQPQAIRELVDGVMRGDEHQVLLGVTGSGKTFTMANIIQQVQRAVADPGPQQDAGGAALSGVPGVLPEQRG